jgi:photosystem II stability/assembly factor-like uncharacterized protein
MKKHILLFLLLVSSLLSAQWKQVSNGLPPDNQNIFIRQIKAIHNFNGTLYVANTYGHLAKSNDDGENWTPFSPGGFSTDPKFFRFASIGNRLFAGLLNSGTSGGIHYSDDNGATFTQVGKSILENSNIISLVAKDGILYAGSSGLYVSSDNGETWVSKSNGLSFLMSVAAIAFDKKGTIYIGGNIGRVFKSTDNGNNWIRIANGLPTAGSGVSALAYINGNLVTSVGAEGIFVSKDEGENWIPATGINTANHKPANDFLVVGTNIIAASAGGAFISYDSGLTWNAYNIGAENGLLCFTLKDNSIFAGGNSKGVFKSEITTVSVNEEILNNDYIVMQNYPNPFNPETTISYVIPNGLSAGEAGTRNEIAHVTLKVYDTLGREIATLVNEVKEQGNHIVKFNAQNIASGVYFYKIQTGNFTQIKKMILSK